MERNRILTLLSSVTLIFSLLSGCSSDQLYEYRAHTDTVTEGAGNAVAVNRAVQTVDSWPTYSQKTEVDMDGKRALAAVRRYENNNSIKPSGEAVASGNGATKN
jgi:hypothetical protein